jgi:tellurite resistance protein TehA-like permease
VIEILFNFPLSENIVIVFLFVFAITFGSLRLAGVFDQRVTNPNNPKGEKIRLDTPLGKKVDAVIALSLSLFSISDAAFVSLIWSNFGTLTLFFMIMFFIGFIITIFGLREETNPATKLLTIGAIFFFVMSLNLAQNNFFSFMPFNGNDAFLLISVVFIIILFWLVMRTGKEGKNS